MKSEKDTNPMKNAETVDTARPGWEHRRPMLWVFSPAASGNPMMRDSVKRARPGAFCVVKRPTQKPAYLAVYWHRAVPMDTLDAAVERVELAAEVGYHEAMRLL